MRPSPVLPPLLAVVLWTVPTLAPAETAAPSTSEPDSGTEGGPTHEHDIADGAGAAADPGEPPARGSSEGRTFEQMLDGLDETGTPEGPSPEPVLPPPSAPPGVERPAPDYDGREAEPASAADVLVWVPRVLFYPVHLVMEWLVRWPLVTGVAFVERHAIIERAREYLTWDDGRAGFAPRFLLDFGVRPHVGVSFFWNEVELLADSDLNASVSLWGDDLVAVRAGTATPIFSNDTAVFSARGSYVRRPDNPYYGLGDLDDRCNTDEGCRFRSAVGEAALGLRAFFDGLNRVTATALFRDAGFSTSSDSVRLTRAQAATIPGFTEGYRLIDLDLLGEIDTRERDVEFEPGTGVRLELGGAFAFDPTDPDLRFARYGGEASAFLELGYGHVLAARLYIEMLTNVSEVIGPGQARVPIPFTELLSLGGGERMRGFLEGRLRGRSAWMLGLEYRYPVWAILDATFFGEVGNTYPSLEEWDLERNYACYGVGLRTSTARDVAVQALVALGSSRFDEPDFEPAQHVRVAFGVSYGF